MLPRGRRAGGRSLGRPTRLVQEETDSEVRCAGGSRSAPCQEDAGHPRATLARHW